MGCAMIGGVYTANFLLFKGFLLSPFPLCFAPDLAPQQGISQRIATELFCAGGGNAEDGNGSSRKKEDGSPLFW